MYLWHTQKSLTEYVIHIAVSHYCLCIKQNERETALIDYMKKTTIRRFACRCFFFVHSFVLHRNHGERTLHTLDVLCFSLRFMCLWGRFYNLHITSFSFPFQHSFSFELSRAAVVVVVVDAADGAAGAMHFFIVISKWWIIALSLWHRNTETFKRDESKASRRKNAFFSILNGNEFERRRQPSTFSDEQKKTMHNKRMPSNIFAKKVYKVNFWCIEFGLEVSNWTDFTT